MALHTGFNEVMGSERETGQSDRIKTQKSRTDAGSPKPENVACGVMKPSEGGITIHFICSDIPTRLPLVIGRD